MSKTVVTVNDKKRVILNDENPIEAEVDGVQFFLRESSDGLGFVGEIPSKNFRKEFTDDELVAMIHETIDEEQNTNV